MTTVIENLKIESVAYGGKGVTRHQGLVYFVQDAVPGDQVSCEVIEAKKHFAMARPTKFHELSPSRGPSPCEYNLKCGGCQWQGIDHKEQVKWKKSFISDALKRIGKLSLPEVWEFYSSEHALGYRSKIFLRGRLQKGRLQLGYFKAASREFLPIEKCMIADELLNGICEFLRSKIWPEISDQKLRLELQILPASRKVLARIFPETREQKDLQVLVKALKLRDTIAWAGLSTSQDESPFFTHEHSNGITYFTSPGQFQQISIVQNHKLRKWVYDKASYLDPQRTLDLYCGSGNLSLQLAFKHSDREIIGVESNAQSIACARYNCLKNDIDNARFHCDDASKFLAKWPSSNGPVDLIIADPPRQGMAKCLDGLQALGAKHLIYVSCDPTTLARDLALISRNYRLVSLAGFDFFPQTFHVETAALLERR